ncbi:uncharacterized protein PFL1_06028 [Pseudozyma flocculosa PF-1]|uniref:Sfi1 spindle body domain-containing protein n=1 Tax=Pseudozyma flocculosa PF-1 TaxID=1277687 RepID=A0A061H3D4_9BASI|nr:uncharacterized protein PFL1_06028 [Pseudozyma flocculosa PF-1]EPQ26380.1 hypothetical protein PFL1_06028 [Pseudozyma flocculosa PF-1]
MSWQRRPTVPHRPASAPTSPEAGPSALAHHYLQRSPYRPAYPSPLSQKPLQASVSSSRTGVSTANSTRSATSDRTASTSATSRFSITQAFSSLRQHEVRFFDQVIDLLPSHAADFAQLKAAYNVVVASEIEGRARSGRNAGKRAAVDGGMVDGDGSDEEQEWDTNLWSCLLSLVKVRGRDWKERWDSVRMALGLEPRSSGDETGQTTQSQDEGDDSASSKSPSASAEDSSSDPNRHPWQRRPTLTHAATPRRQQEDASHHQRMAGQKRKADVPHSRHEAAAVPEVVERNSRFGTAPGPSRRRGDAEAGPSRPRLRANSHEDRLDSPRSSSFERIERRRMLQLGVDGFAEAEPRSDTEPLDSVRSRLQRMRIQSGGPEDSEARGQRFDSSMSDPEDSTRALASSSPSGLPSTAQRRFQEVVRNSQAEREALRRARIARQEAEEEQQWSEEARRADEVFAHRLLRTCLQWWLTVARRQAEQVRHASEAHDRIVLARSWDRWKETAQQESAERVRAERIDQVRCKLGAWRRWRRLCRQRQAAKQDEKKRALHKAYYQVTKRQKRHVVRDSYQAWRGLYLERVADAIRRRHLQQGAFAIWQLRLARSANLAAQEFEVVQRHRFRLIDAAWTEWHRRTMLSIWHNTLTVAVDRHLVAGAFALWRKQTLLRELAEAFERRRLQTAGFVGWNEARHVAAEQRRKEALADRWRNRRSKRSALQHWRHRLSSLVELVHRADRFVEQVGEARLASALSIWVALERGTLLVRVRDARALEAMFAQWRQHHRALTTSLAQRESTVGARRRENTLAMALEHWRQRCSNVLGMQRLAVDTDAARVRFTLLDLWRGRVEAQGARERQAVVAGRAMVQRRALSVWTARLRQARLEALLSDRDDQARVSHLVSRRDGRLRAEALQHWLHLTIERRNAELNAALYRRLKQQQAAFYHWISLCLKHDDMLNLVQSHVDLKRAAQVQRAFSVWLSRARAERDRRQRLSSFLAGRRHTSLLEGFETWRGRYLESTLRSIEYEVTLKHHEVSVLRLLRVWQERTTALPAIRLRNRNLKRLALHQWIRALPNQRRSRLAQERDEDKVKHGAMAVWKAKWRERKRVRAAQRFGALGVGRLRKRSGGSLRPATLSSSSSPSAASSSKRSIEVETRMQRRWDQEHHDDGDGEGEGGGHDAADDAISSSSPSVAPSAVPRHDTPASHLFRRFRRLSSPARPPQVDRG